MHFPHIPQLAKVGVLLGLSVLFFVIGFLGWPAVSPLVDSDENPPPFNTPSPTPTAQLPPAAPPPTFQRFNPLTPVPVPLDSVPVPIPMTGAGVSHVEIQPSVAPSLPPPILPTSSPSLDAPTPPSTPVAPPTPEPTAPPTPTVTPPPPIAAVRLNADATRVAPGQQVTVEIVVQASPASPVRAAQVFLNFDPARLRVVRVQDGRYLERPLQSDADGSLGRVDYAAGTVRGNVDFPFVLAAVTFEVSRQSAGNAVIRFAPRQVPRQTKVISDGFDVTGDLYPLTLEIG